MERSELHIMRIILWLSLSALLLSCGAEVEDNSLLVPRGATISVRTLASISTETHRKGDSFSAILDVPLSNDMTIYVPLESRVDGVVEETRAVVGNNTPALISVCLKKLYLPNGATIDLETNAIARVARPMLQEEMMGMATGLAETIAELTGRTSEEAQEESGVPGTGIDKLISNNAVFPANSSLVFTLDSDLRIPAPQ